MKFALLVATVAIFTVTACSSGTTDQALGLAGDEASPSTAQSPSPTPGTIERPSLAPSETFETDASDVNVDASDDLQVNEDIQVVEDAPPELEVSQFTLPGRPSEGDVKTRRELCQLLESRRSQGIDQSILFDCFRGTSFDSPLQDICRRLDLSDHTWDNQIEAICGAQLRRVNGCVIREGTSCVGADLSASQFNKARLRRSNFSQANLSGAQLSNADLAHADFRGADLAGADLSNAQMYGANLTGATLRGVNISGTDFSAAVWTDGSRCNAPSPRGTCLITQVIDLARDLR